MDTKNQDRVPRGVPIGGEFAEGVRSEPELLTTDSAQFDASADSLADSLLDPRSKPGRVHIYAYPDPEAAEATRTELLGICEARHPIEDIDVPSLPIMARGEAYEHARHALPAMSSEEFEWRWGRVEMAHARMAAFACPDGPEMTRDLHPSEEAISRASAQIESQRREFSDSDYASRLSVEWSHIYSAALDEAVLAEQEAADT